MKKNYNLKRAEKMLKSDRLGLASGAEDIIKFDIENLLCEYFCLRQRPKITLDGNADNIQIEIKATAKAVKRFSILK